MANYKFSNFQIELENPTIESVQPTYTLGSDFVDVYATLKTSDAKLYGVFLGQMDNTEAWLDEDVMSFAVAQLETFLV